MTTKLRPCPFCGDAKQLRFYEYLGRIVCDACHTLGPLKGSERAARTAWNRRKG
jgi:Lar family restriction alleviation protein